MRWERESSPPSLSSHEGKGASWRALTPQKARPADSDTATSAISWPLRLHSLPTGGQIELRVQARGRGGWGEWSELLHLSLPPASLPPLALPTPRVVGFSAGCDAVSLHLPPRRNGCNGDGHVAVELQPSGARSWLSVRQNVPPGTVVTVNGLDREGGSGEGGVWEG